MKSIRSASFLLFSCMIDASLSPQRSPSPVDEKSFKMMCPDGSPPSFISNSLIFSITYLSPTSALKSVIPFSLRAFSKPLFDIVVPTILSYL